MEGCLRIKHTIQVEPFMAEMMDRRPKRSHYKAAQDESESNLVSREQKQCDKQDDECNELNNNLGEEGEDESNDCSHKGHDGYDETSSPGFANGDLFVGCR